VALVRASAQRLDERKGLKLRGDPHTS
jgi:hypothetical protein